MKNVLWRLANVWKNPREFVRRNDWLLSIYTLNHWFASSWCRWIWIEQRLQLCCHLPFFVGKESRQLPLCWYTYSWQRKGIFTRIRFITHTETMNIATVWRRKNQITLHYSCLVWFGSVRLVAIYVLLLWTLIPLFMYMIWIYVHVYIDRTWKIAKWNETVSVFNFEKVLNIRFCLFVYCTLDYTICLLW